MTDVPKTAEELKEAINNRFENRGEYKTRYIICGDQAVEFKSYISSADPDVGFFSHLALHAAEEEAIKALWEAILLIGSEEGQTQEVREDEVVVLPPSTVYWRSLPEVKTTKNGLFHAMLRAAFI